MQKNIHLHSYTSRFGCMHSIFDDWKPHDHRNHSHGIWCMIHNVWCRTDGTGRGGALCWNGVSCGNILVIKMQQWNKSLSSSLSDFGCFWNRFIKSESKGSLEVAKTYLFWVYTLIESTVGIELAWCWQQIWLARVIKNCNKFIL